MIVLDRNESTYNLVSYSLGGTCDDGFGFKIRELLHGRLSIVSFSAYVDSGVCDGVMEPSFSSFSIW